MKNDGLTGMDRRGKALTIWTLAAIAGAARLGCGK